MFERVLAFFKELPAGGSDEQRKTSTDDPRIAAAALLYHVMDADGVRRDVEWERMKGLLTESYDIRGDELDRLVVDGAEADQEAVDLYAFTSVLKRHLNQQARLEFVRVMWEVVYADGELHELEDHTLWRIAGLLGVDDRDRIRMRQEVAGRSPVPADRSTGEG